MQNQTTPHKTTNNTTSYLDDKSQKKHKKTLHIYENHLFKLKTLHICENHLFKLKEKGKKDTKRKRFY